MVLADPTVVNATGFGEPASPTNCLAPVVVTLNQAWPENHLVNSRFPGQSVPAGFFQTTRVDSLH